MKNNSPVNFIMFNTELLEWVGEKDRRHYTSEKMKKGIMSYTQALHDIGFFFKKVCTNEVRPNSQPLSAWARSWGWDFRKTVRFVNIVLRYLFDLNHALKKAKDLKERIENAYDRQKKKTTNYMRKIRNSAISSAQDIVNENETADERLFLDAMAALAKTNPIYYRAKIKEKLRVGDVGTVANFQYWIEKNNKEKKEEFLFSIRGKKICVDDVTQVILGVEINDGKCLIHFLDGSQSYVNYDQLYALFNN